MKPKRKPRQWWNQYLATLAKSGSDGVAIHAASVNRAMVTRACALYPDFAERRRKALERGRMVAAVRVPGRGRGRPNCIAPHHHTVMIQVYGESGSGGLAASTCGVSLSAVQALRRRDSVFDVAWLAARAQAAFIACELGPWWQREADLYVAIDRGMAFDVAARSARVPEWLAALLYQQRIMTPAQRKRYAAKIAPPRAANRFDLTPKPSHVLARPAVQYKASKAELAAMESGAALERDAKRMTPEMLAFAALVADDGLSLDAACLHAGRTLREVNMWADSNAYFRQCVFD